MKLSLVTLGALARAVLADEPSPECAFANTPECAASSSFRIPTAAESAVMGRRILALSKLGTLSTVFPSAGGHDAASDPTMLEQRPAGMGGIPIGLMDYVADCEDSGDPTILAIKIATSFKNVEAGSNMSLSMRWIPPYNPAKRIGVLDAVCDFTPFRRWCQRRQRRAGTNDEPDTVPYSAANLPRFSLFGYTEWIAPDPTSDAAIRSCFVEKHADAKFWMPGNHIHQSAWMRLVVTEVYWIGGFGDRAYIGWIPVEDWKAVTKEQWSAIRLQGETEGWNEWDRPKIGPQGMVNEFDL